MIDPQLQEAIEWWDVDPEEVGENPYRDSLLDAAKKWQTIQNEGGEVRGWCAVHDAQAWDGRDLFCLLHPGDPEERSCQMERVIVIPFELGAST